MAKILGTVGGFAAILLVLALAQPLPQPVEIPVPAGPPVGEVSLWSTLHRSCIRPGVVLYFGEGEDKTRFGTVTEVMGGSTSAPRFFSLSSVLGVKSVENVDYYTQRNQPWFVRRSDPYIGDFCK
jgi:hypothetical protein